MAVSKKGVITAKKAGSMTTIRSEDGNIVYNVYVIQPKFAAKTASVAAGEEVQLVLELGGNAAEYPVAWSSSAPAVASVTGGRVYGIAKGSAKITATVNGKAYNCTVKVNDTKKIKVDASTSEIVLAPMQSVNTKLKGVWSADETMQNVGTEAKPVYANSVVSVTKSGKITAIGSGTTKLHAPGGRSITVTVGSPVEQVKYVAAGKKISLKYTSVKNAKVTDWKSSNAAVATVDKGKVVTKSAGYTTISCTYKAYDIDGAGFTYLTTVYVEKPDLNATKGITHIKGDKYELHLKKGAILPVRFTSNSSCAVYQPVVFKSNKAAVAYADEKGMIHAVSNGKAKLTTVINKKTITLTVIVDQ